MGNGQDSSFYKISVEAIISLLLIAGLFCLLDLVLSSIPKSSDPSALSKGAFEGAKLYISLSETLTAWAFSIIVGASFLLAPQRVEMSPAEKCLRWSGIVFCAAISGLIGFVYQRSISVYIFNASHEFVGTNLSLLAHFQTGLLVISLVFLLTTTFRIYFRKINAPSK